MKISKMTIAGIPVNIFGNTSDKMYIYVHGKMGKKEDALNFAETATNKGFQVLSFDLPEHGERTDEAYPNNIWNGIADLCEISNYAKSTWKEINLYAISIGAYYSLMAYENISIKNCMFVSPIVDMKKLIENMLLWPNHTIKEFSEKRKIETTFGETLDIDYYNFILKNPVENWKYTTHILYGMLDNMTDVESINNFSKKFDCNLTTFSDMEHYLNTKEDILRLKEWEEKSIL